MCAVWFHFPTFPPWQKHGVQLLYGDPFSLVGWLYSSLRLRSELDEALKSFTIQSGHYYFS
jgi:hypothetical protein